MIAVVFDLELVKRFRKGQLSEIVEIGACKVDLEAKIITGQFQVYISPGSGYIAKSTRKFINMKKEDVKKAVPFRVGIERFAEWLGEDDFLCSWGKDDRVHIVSQCLRNKMKLGWFKNYNDIQQKLGKVLTGNTKNQLGLKNALDLSGIDPVGKAHRGIDDALNTAELLIQYADQIILDRNIFIEKETSTKPAAGRHRFLHKQDIHNQKQQKGTRKANHTVGGGR